MAQQLNEKNKTMLFVVITKLSQNKQYFYFIKSKWIHISKINDLVKEITLRQKECKEIYRVYLFEKYISQKQFN